MKKTFRYLLCIFVLAAVSFGIVRIVAFNNKFPAAKEVVIPRGDTLHFWESTNTVKDAKILTVEDFYQAYPAIKEDETIDLSYIDSTLLVTISYTGDISPIIKASAESGAWANASNLIISHHVNHGVKSGTVVLPFDVAERQFRPEHWKTLSLDGFRLVLSGYPQKNILCLT